MSGVDLIINEISFIGPRNLVCNKCNAQRARVKWRIGIASKVLASLAMRLVITAQNRIDAGLISLTL